MSDVDDGDYVPGDQTCNVCYGLTYYDAAMQATKRPFLCFGFRTNDEDPNPQACIEYEKLSAPVFDSYMCIGKAVTSGRMDRLCKAPARINGVEFVTVKESIKIGEKHNKVLEQRNKMLSERRSTLQAKEASESAESQEKP